MYLVIELDYEIEVIVFDWVFEYEEVFDVRDLDMWHLILYVNEKEWRDIEMPDDSELPDDVMWFYLCLDKELMMYCKYTR